VADEAPIGAALNRDLAPGEDVEWQLDALLSQRDKQRREEEGDRAEEAAFREAERREAARRAEVEAWIKRQMANDGDVGRTAEGDEE
jgi:hypothetical protein